MNIDTIIFFISAVVAVFGATMMITQRNPVASVMYFILSIVAQAVCYIQLGALFIGAMLVIVYAGAIMVLFLFVIMILNLRSSDDFESESKPISKATKYIVSLGLIFEFIMIIKGIFLQSSSTGIQSMPVDNFGDIAVISKMLFTRYLYPFELTGILLLIAVVGAVVLAKRDSVDEYETEQTERVAE